MTRILSALLCIFMLIPIATPASASESNNPQWIQEETIFSEPFVVPELVGKSAPGNIGTYAYGKRTVVGDIFTTNKVIYVYPIHQPSLGFEGTDGASATFFYTSGSSVTFTISISNNIFEFTAETGYHVQSGGAYTAAIPTSSGRYLLKFKKDYIIRTVRYDVYSGGNVYQYSYYSHDPQYALGHSWIKVG